MTPEPNNAVQDAVAGAADVLRGRHAVVLTGAGVSTESGIASYRGEGSAPPAIPMRIEHFAGDGAAQRAFWLASHRGWPAFDSAEPNAAHVAIAELEAAGAVRGVITQNVDGLHLRAGSVHVVELHGAIRRVICLNCRQVFDRRDIAAQIAANNPPLAASGPDDAFVVPRCTSCEGRLKPDYVFFGEDLAADKLAAAASLVRNSDALIVGGSSLVVNSGVHLLTMARRRGIPIVIINTEPTHADRWAQQVIRATAGEAFPALRDALAAASA